jgi:uncharacterized membrane protein YfcA
LPIQHAILLFIAALIAGALNAVAGGGSFVAFPALVFVGIPPINANATNSCAVWPGTVASAIAYRNTLRGRVATLIPLVITGIIGGSIGSLVLLHTPQRTFMNLVPWFLLCATLLFAFSQRITRAIRSRAQFHPESRLTSPGGIFLQFIISLYIGYFGAGAGILTLAMLALLGETDIHVMNGIKTLLATLANGTALVIFIVKHAIVWPQALLMAVGAALGGYFIAWYAQRIDPRITRALVIITGFGMAAYFFIRY